jgi:hypothetical protein
MPRVRQANQGAPQHGSTVLGERSRALALDCAHGIARRGAAVICFQTHQHTSWLEVDEDADARYAAHTETDYEAPGKPKR